MTQTDLSKLPIPTGAVAGNWTGFTNYPEDLHRPLTWSSRDVGGVVVTAQGVQRGADGRIERHVGLWPEYIDTELSVAAARQLAAALLDAAEAIDSVR
jgi:hypothetical protein